MFDDLFGLGGWNPLLDALNMLYNDTPRDNKGVEVMKFTKNNKVVYVAIVKCPGLERKDLNIEFSQNDRAQPILRVSGSTETNFGTYSVDVGAAILLREKVRIRDEGTVLKNGILYIYLDPESTRKGAIAIDGSNPDFA